MWKLLVDSFRLEWERLVRWSPRLVVAALVVAVAILVARGIKKAIKHGLDRTDVEAIHAAFIQRVAFWLVTLVGFSIALATLGLSGAAGGLLTGGGLVAVVLAFAFREIGESLLAGTLLALRRPFRIGDLIKSGEFEGIVTAIEIRHTHLRTADGRDIFVPSSMIFKDPLVNYTLDGMRRFSLEVGVDYRNDGARACSLLMAEAQGIDGVLADPPADAWIAAFRDSWIELEVVFWVDVFKSRDFLAVRTAVFHACCQTLLREGYTVSSEVSSAVQVTQVPSSTPAG